MIARILVPLDGSELAEKSVQYALELARPAGAGIDLVQVVHAGLAAAPEAGQTEETRSLAEIAADARAYLDKVAAGVKAAGLAARTFAIEAADAAAGIREVARREKSDLIVMSTHGRSGLSKLLMGSVAQQVLAETVLPVLLIRVERVRPPRIEEVDTILSAH